MFPALFQPNISKTPVPFRLSDIIFQMRRAPPPPNPKLGYRDVGGEAGQTA